MRISDWSSDVCSSYLASIFVNLNTLRSGSPALVEAGWFDAYGDQFATSRDLDPAPTNAAGEEFFRAPREQPLPGVYVATPTPSVDAGRDWDVRVSLRLANLDGSFAGVASGRDRKDTRLNSM